MRSWNKLPPAAILMLAAAAAVQAADQPQQGAGGDAQARETYKQMIDETQKMNELCVRDHFGKACIKAQEEFQRKFLGKVPANHGNGLPYIPGQQPKQGK